MLEGLTTIDINNEGGKRFIKKTLYETSNLMFSFIKKNTKVRG